MADKDKLYEFLVIKHPTKKERDDGERAKIIVPRREIIARTDEEAMMQAHRKISDEHMKDAERLDVVVRPF